MALKKISELPAITAVDTDDVFPIVEDGTTKQMQMSELITFLNANGIGSPDSEAAVVAAEVFS